MKITLDFSVVLKDLDASPVQPEVRLGPQLALSLVGQAQGNVVKYYDWAVALHKGQPIEVDQADWETLRRFIENAPTITILGKRQMMDVMDKARESAKTSE